jgi:hypothetical protein
MGRAEEIEEALVRLLEIAADRHIERHSAELGANGSLDSPAAALDDRLIDDVVRLVSAHIARASRRTVQDVTSENVAAFTASAIHRIRRLREEQTSTMPPPDLQTLVDEWHRPLRRPVVLIDETRRGLHEDARHGEFLVFVAVCAGPEQVVAYLNRMQDLRGKFPKGWEEMPIKGQNIWRDDLKPEFMGLVGALEETLRPPVRVFVCATTQGNLKERAARATITTTPVAGADGDGRPPRVQGPELAVALNFVLRLCQDLGERVRADVLIDKSQALGLDNAKRGLSAGRVELLHGPLKTDGPVICLVSASDSEHSKDLVLLPDFCGNALLHKSDEKLASDLARVKNEDTPFWYREISSEELANAIRLGKEKARSS